MDPLLVVIVGPTGSGKSDLALHLAGVLDGEIVNCDSMQIYRGFDIGTAKPTAADRAQVPHHLFDIAGPEDTFTAGEYANLARDVVTGIARRGRLPIVVGGTGFYLRALLDGLFTGPGRDPALRARLEKHESRRPGSLHRILRRVDPSSASRIHVRDIRKLVRALEVCITAGEPLSRMFASGRDALQGFRVAKLGLNPPRQILYERLNVRSRRLFDQGLLEEVRSLLAHGVSNTAKPFESIGYKEALACLRGELRLDQAIEITARNTRRYAKRQWTWWRKELDIQWLSGFGSDPQTRLAALQVLKSEIVL
jgi:tRNA dimethylallyltransferase